MCIYPIVHEYAQNVPKGLGRVFGIDKTSVDDALQKW